MKNYNYEVKYTPGLYEGRPIFKPEIPYSFQPHRNYSFTNIKNSLKIPINLTGWDSWATSIQYQDKLPTDQVYLKGTISTSEGIGKWNLVRIKN